MKSALVFLRVVPLLLAAALAACTSPITNVAAGNPASRAIGPSGGAEAATEIAVGDRLRIAVFGDDKMSGEYNVGESGAITVPLAGPVSVAGRTPEDAAKAIASVLVTAGLFRDPKITVEILTLRPFYILGEVNRPGEYPYRPGLSLFAAVATAGGYTYRADSGSVFIRKATEKTERKFDINSDIAIMPGDVIRIPERYF
ncbi:hypothetical protein sos41_30260 [Alphaproteobacteria bacterium SO-S41]|nr:hypothetical protein sos41_30260 [Alphaproteobacteria bacterium SO-S41]